MSGKAGGPGGGGPAPPSTLREAIAAMFHFEWVDRSDILTGKLKFTVFNPGRARQNS